MGQGVRLGFRQDSLIEGARPHVRRGAREPPGRPARALTLLGHVSVRAAFLSELKLFSPKLAASWAGGWAVRAAARLVLGRAGPPGSRFGSRAHRPNSALRQSSLLPGRLCSVHFLIHRRVFLYAFLISVCFCFASLSDFSLRGSVCLAKKQSTLNCTFVFQKF